MIKQAQARCNWCAEKVAVTDLLRHEIDCASGFDVQPKGWRCEPLPDADNQNQTTLRRVRQNYLQRTQNFA